MSEFLAFKLKTLKFCPVPPTKSMALIPEIVADNDAPAILVCEGVVIALTDALLLKFQ